MAFFPLKKIAQLYLYDLSFNRFFSFSSNTSYGLSHYGYLFPFLLVLGSCGIINQLKSGPKAKNRLYGTLALLTLFLFIGIIAFRMPRPHDHRFMIWLVPCLGLLTLSFLHRTSSKLILVLVTAIGLLAMSDFIYIRTQSTFGRINLSSLNHLIQEGSFLRYVDFFPEGLMTRSSGKKVTYLQGYQQLEKRAHADDWILYIGESRTNNKSYMYPSWGPRFSRTVHSVSDIDDAVQKIRSGDYRFIIMEKKADKTLRNSCLKVIKSSDYQRISKMTRRAVYQRP